jgi:hypothetical protein
MENRIDGGGTHDLRIGGGRTDTEPTPSLLAPEKNRGGQRRKKSRVRKKTRHFKLVDLSTCLEPHY